jgi:hypothetical protein
MYETADKSNYNKHIKSRKHTREVSIPTTPPITAPIHRKRKVPASEGIIIPTMSSNSIVTITNYVCPDCHIPYSRKDSLVRHMKKCPKAEQNNNIQTEMVEHLKNEVTYLRDMGKTTAKNTSKAMSVLNYVMYNYMDAPTLPAITAPQIRQIVYKDYDKLNMKALTYREDDDDDDIEDDESNSDMEIDINDDLTPYKSKTRKHDDIVPEERIEEMLIFQYNTGTLVKYIGTGIIDIYKKDNPNDQSMWISDCSRLNYVVKTIVDGDDRWAMDKKGMRVIKKVTVPLLKEIYNIMREYLNNKRFHEVTRFGEYSKKLNAIFGIMDSVETQSMHTDIVRFIAPYFSIESEL